MKIMTQEEYIEYLKRKAKWLEIDYIKMLERMAYLKYQADIMAKNTGISIDILSGI